MITRRICEKGGAGDEIEVMKPLYDKILQLGNAEALS